ncbi:MAG: hypothetical protein C0616_13510 [Desulfuromonas sp.]|nr:MAG: hypothetical protein C0616_13510 [Desulfuromonas sp.]
MSEALRGEMSGTLLNAEMTLEHFVREYVASLGGPKAGVIDVLTKQGDKRLKQYVQDFAVNRSQPLQSRKDLVRMVSIHTERLFGPGLANAMVARLERQSVVLTANHHGVDYHPIYVQGTVLYALPELLGQSDRPPGHEAVVPVFSFGSVSLNNATFPRGILLPAFPHPREQSSHRIGVFPDRLKHTMVSFTPPMTRKMITAAMERVEKLDQTRSLSRNVAARLTDILKKDYLSDEVLAQESYSDQASLLNDRLWRKVLGKSEGASPLRVVYLEIEPLVSDLLVQHDLHDENSLAYRVLFDQELRHQVIDNLDSVSGCWYSSNGRGTTFFWGVDPQGRRFPLQLEEEGSSDWLVGKDWKGESHRFRFAAQELEQALADRRLLPGMFLCFLQFAFARGIRCFGGPWQTTYLPRMQARLAAALGRTKGYEDWKTSVEGVPTANYVAGMTLAIAEGEGAACEAGMVELLAAGGLSTSDFELLGNIRVKNAILNNFLLDKSPELVKMCCASNHPQILALKI